MEQSVLRNQHSNNLVYSKLVNDEMRDQLKSYPLHNIEEFIFIEGDLLLVHAKKRLA